MSDQGEGMGRAGSYVLGLMNAAGRERAERLPRNEPIFDASSHGDGWQEIRRRLAELPQMSRAPEGAEPPAGRRAAFGRRLADLRSGPRLPTAGARAIEKLLPSLPDRREFVIAGALLAFFALGYLSGIASAVPFIGLP